MGGGGEEALIKISHRSYKAQKSHLSKSPSQIPVHQKPLEQDHDITAGKLLSSRQKGVIKLCMYEPR